MDSTYAKEDLKQVANNATQMNAEEITQLLSLFKYFQDLFDGTLGDWTTETFDLEPPPCTRKSQCHANKLFTLSRKENN